MSDLLNRLRGQYNLPITDGGGPINGSMEYKRSFVMPPICGEAANEIDRLTRELAEKDAEIARLRKDAERWKEVVCRIRTGAIHNGQKVNDKLINGHRDRNRILFSLIGEADPYDPGDKDGFQKVIDAAIAAKQ